MTPAVFVVIPVRNRKQKTLDCLACLAAQAYPNLTAIVIDDGSTDGTAESIAEQYPHVTILQGDGELWWTASVNLGVEYALREARAGDFILTLNDDTLCGPEYVGSLVDQADDSSVVGSVLIDADTRKVLDGGVSVNWLTARFEPTEGMDVTALQRASSLRDVDVLPGRGTLVPVSAFQKCGLFDQTSLPHYGADYEFAARVARAGYRLVVSTSSVLSDAGESGDVRLSPLAWLTGFFSRRSPCCLRYRYNLAVSAPPGLYVVPFLVADIVRVLFGQTRRMLQSLIAG